MKKFFPLILAISVGLGGYFYFNLPVVSEMNIKNVYVYNYDTYKDKNPTPFIRVEEKKLMDIIVETINSSKSTKREISVTNPNYVLDVRYSEDKIKTFHLWLTESTKIGMYKNKEDNRFLILSEKDTNKLKTLMFR